MDKKAFRKEVLEKIAALPEEYIASSNRGIYENFISMPEFINAKSIFAYISEKREPDTIRIIEKALEMGKTVALPVSYEGGVMVPKVVKSLDGLEIGLYGIPAPSENSPTLSEDEVDLIIVPAVTFNKSGYRLGRGGGYYDRFLSKAKAISVGLGREELLCDVPLEKHDMSVNYLVTEVCVYK